MADFNLNNVRLSLRNDLAATWTSVNPVLLKGEIGIEIDTGKFKFGDGSKQWNDLKYASTDDARVQELIDASVNAAKTELNGAISTAKQDAITEAGTNADAKYLPLAGGTVTGPIDMSNSAITNIATPTGNNDAANKKYVDDAIIKAGAYELPVATTETLGGVKAPVGDQNIRIGQDGTIKFNISPKFYDVYLSKGESGSATAFVTTTGITFNPGMNGGEPNPISAKISGLATPTGDNDAANKKYVDDAVAGKQDTITGAATSIVSDDLTADKVLISGASGKVAASTVTTTELSYLAGVTGGIQAQIDNIPKYNYKNGVEISVTDGSEQEAINTAAKAKLTETYTESAKYDASVVNITFTPSDTEKDALYMYDGADWTFLYYVSTGINRANGTTAGIVENSDDITFVDGQGTVVQAGRVKNALTVGGKTFDGSDMVTIVASDLGALTAIPESYVENTDFGTAEIAGVVKSSSADNQVSIGADGLMTVNNITGNKVTGKVEAASTADKVANTLTIQKNGEDVDTFDGSAAKTVNIEVPTASTELTDSATLLRSTDTFILNCGGASVQ